MPEKKFTVDEIMNLIKDCFKEMIEKDFFIKFVKKIINLNDSTEDLFGVDNVEEMLICLLAEKIGLSYTSIIDLEIVSIDELLKVCLVDGHSEEDIKNIDNFIGKEFEKIESVFNEILKTILTDKDNFEFLIDNQIDLDNLFRYIVSYYADKDIKNRYNVIDQKSNGLIKCCDLNLLKKIIDSEMFGIIKYIPDEVFLELPKEYLDKIIPHFFHIALFGQEEKIKYILNHANLVDLLKILKEKQQSSCEQVLFSCVENMDDEVFNIIIKNNLYKSIENCKVVISNDGYVKKLLEKKYGKIIWSLEEHQFNGELLETMKEKNIFSYAFSEVANSYEILRSDYVFNLFVEQINDTYTYHNLIERTPEDALTDIRILTCMLNCDFMSGLWISEEVKKRIKKYENRTLDDIRYAIELGYKCSKKTSLKNLDEVKIFIENGQPEIINNFLNVDLDTIKYAIEHGYKFDSDTPTNVLTTEIFEFCLEKKNYDIIVEFFLRNSYDLKNIIKQYINDNPTCSEDGSFLSFFKNIGILDKFIDTLILRKPHERYFNREDWLKYAKEKYKDNSTLLKYIEFLKSVDISDVLNLKNIIKSIEDVYTYFDELGPNEQFYNSALTNPYLFEQIFKLEYYEWKTLYNPPEEVSKYIEFSKKYGLVFNQYIHTKEDIIKYFTATGVSEEFKILLRDNPNKTKNLLSTLAHNGKLLNNLSLEFANIFEYYIIDTYFKALPKKEQKKKYDYLIKNIGPIVIFNFELEKINKLIDIDVNELNKLFLCLNSAKYKVVPSNIAYDNIVISLVNFEFIKNYPHLVNIFTDLNSILIRISNEEFEEYISGKNKGELSIKLNFICCDIISYLNLDENEIQDFKQALVECKNFKEDKLRNYCRKYLKRKEKEYLDDRSKTILNEIGIPLRFDREDSVDKLNIFIQNNISYLAFDNYRHKISDGINYQELSPKIFIESLNMTKAEYEELLAITENEFVLIVTSIRNKTKPADSIKKKLQLFRRFSKQYALYTLDNEDNYSLLKQLKVKEENIIELKDLNIINILKEMDIDIYLNTVAKDNELLSHLSKIFEWYFIGRLPESFNNFFERYDVKLPGGINDIGVFITKYYNILLQKERLLKRQGTEIKSLSEIRFFFTEIVEYISRTNSETVEIMKLLGSEEYNDFITNAPNNSANFSRLERERKLVPILDFLYTLDKVTIPSKDIVISNNDNTKQINFIVGNRTNPSNICHGERTGACMRVGGIGEGLFLKCLTDKNWFHIRIEDPVTHEYISRVSGFRNGNTVYLNQLRNSAKPDKYSNQDLQEFIKIYAKSLISDTKTSEYPIENVFINTNYAMEGYEDEEYKRGEYVLGDIIQKEYNLDDVLNYRLRDSTDIWTDVKSEAYLLATTEEGAKTSDGYVPLKNGPESVEVYDAVRDKIYGLEYITGDIPKHQFVIVEQEVLREKVNRVHAMKEKLLGKDYRYDIIDEIPNENSVIEGYASSDWYVYMDASFGIHYDYIKERYQNGVLIPYNSSEKACEEMEKYKEILINKYDLDRRKVNV